MKLFRQSVFVFTLVVLLALGLSGQTLYDTMRLIADPPPPPARQVAGYVGSGGGTTLYYWVAARYPSGLAAPGIPIRVGQTVPIASLDATHRVQLGWDAAPGATGYYVIRLAASNFTGTCTSCVVLANSNVTGFSDEGGATTDYPPAGVGTVANSTFLMTLDNYTEATPFIRTVTNGVTGRLPDTTTGYGLDVLGDTGLTSTIRGQYGSTLNNEAANAWVSDSELRVSDPASAYIDWSALTGTPSAFASLVEVDFVNSTRIHGANFQVRSIGGAAGTERVIGMQSLAFSGTGTTVISHVIGATSRANHDTGSVNAAIGLDGILDIGAGATLNAEGFASGVQGIYLDAAGVAAVDRYTAAVTGVIWDVDTPGPQGAVLAVLNGDSIRTAPNSPPAAFKVIDRTTTGGVNFNIGLDLYYNSGALSNIFNTAAIRGQSLDLLNNAAAGYWTISRGSGAFTGFTIDATAFTDLPAATNGTTVYCSDCDPAAAGAGPTVCTSAGTQTGAMAFRLAGAWTCLGI